MCKQVWITYLKLMPGKCYKSVFLNINRAQNLSKHGIVVKSNILCVLVLQLTASSILAHVYIRYDQVQPVYCNIAQMSTLTLLLASNTLNKYRITLWQAKAGGYDWLDYVLPHWQPCIWLFPCVLWRLGPPILLTWFFN